MRKISKSRADDDVVSSTNGSLANEDHNESEPKEDNGADSEANDVGSDVNEKNDNDSDFSKDTPKKSKASKGKRGRKRKSAKGDKDEAEEDGADSDAANDVSSEVNEKNDNDSDYSKDTPKKAKASKGKKGKKKKAAKDKDEPEEEYEVEKVIDSKKIKGKVHYLIRWKGYSADSDTWEPENTLSCPELINKFNEEKENSKDKESSSPSKGGRKRKSGKKETKVASKRPKTDWDSENADETAEYEVDRILEVHHKKNGKREFLIHWKGWSSKFDSWEPENNLNCGDLIKKFMEKVDAAKSTDSRNLRVNPESTNRFTLQARSTGRRLSKRRGQSQRVRYDNAE